MKLTTIETLILKAANSRPCEWLYHHRAYLGEVLSLQMKGLAATRTNADGLQVKSLIRKELG